MIKLKDLINESYIGSCVDVGRNNTYTPICDIFHDATELDRVVNEGENNIEVSPETFYKYVNKKDVKPKMTRGKVEYYRIKEDQSGNPMNDEESSLWWIYNVDDDVHYFFLI